MLVLCNLARMRIRLYLYVQHMLCALSLRLVGLNPQYHNIQEVDNADLRKSNVGSTLLRGHVNKLATF